MRRIIATILLLTLALAASAQADRHDVRAGNRKFGKDKFKQSEIDYRKAVLKDSTSLKAQYDLASSLYRQEDYEGAGKALESVKSKEAPAQYYYNLGDVALKKKDWKSAVDAFRQSLLMDPGDLDAKENYIYAKKMLQNQQGGGGGNGQNQDQQNQQDQNNQNQNNDQNQDNQDQNQQNQPNQDQQNPQGGQPQESQGGLSQQQAQQMLKAIQAKEQETQDKVNKEKAAVMKSRQKEKNW